jgi:riboflavin kinase
MEILPASGYCHGRLFKATIDEIECAVVIPDVAVYPENVLEVIAPVNLREKLQVSDGSLVKINVKSRRASFLC